MEAIIYECTNNLVVAYLTDAKLWLQLKGERGYVSWQGNNLLLTSVHHWMRDCIRDWTQKWDPALIKIAV